MHDQLIPLSDIIMILILPSAPILSLSKDVILTLSIEIGIRYL